MLDSIDPFYQSVNTKCVDDNNPTLIKTRMEGGVTFIVKSSILKYVECIELDEKRITGIEIPTLNSERIFCFCVYEITIALRIYHLANISDHTRWPFQTDERLAELSCCIALL
jgi:hypothetical protein